MLEDVELELDDVVGMDLGRQKRRRSVTMQAPSMSHEKQPTNPVLGRLPDKGILAPACARVALDRVAARANKVVQL